MKLSPSLTPSLSAWAMAQPVFTVATSPTHGGRVNTSPKGLSSHFAVLSPGEVAYVDRTGSGCETVAHVYDNGRLTFMFMSFGPAPRIMRLFCKGRVVERDDEPAFEALVRRVVGAGAGKEKNEDEEEDVEAKISMLLAGARAVVIGEVYEVQTSCGYAVPMVRRELYHEDGAAGGQDEGDSDSLDGDMPLCRELAVFEERTTMDQWTRKSVAADKMHAYQRKNNARSIDGLPGLRVARKDAGEWVWLGDAGARLDRVASEKTSLLLGFALGVGAVVASSFVRGQISRA